MTNLSGPFNAFGSALPLTLGSTALLYGMVAPQYMGAGVLAALLGLVLIHLLGAASSRPVYYSARFFEAATLGTMVLKLGVLLESSGQANTAEARLMLLISIGAIAALVSGLLWAMKVQRFARFIPAPVYVGFVNAVAIAVLISQTQSVAKQSAASPVAWMPLAVVALTLAVALAVRYLRPRWPASSMGLAAGLLLSIALDPQLHTLPRVMAWSTWSLPVLHADMSVWAPGSVAWGAVGGWVVINGLIMGTLVFLNTVSTGQMLAQTDDRETVRPVDGWRETAGLFLAGLAGSSPLSGSPGTSMFGTQNGPLMNQHLLVAATLMLLITISQVMVWLPLAAISGVMFYDAWSLWNRGSVRHAWLWVRRQPLTRHTKEDILLIVSVMAASLLVNMVAGLVSGLVLGLLLHAQRSTRQPVRNIWDGHQIASNCARSRAELKRLSEHGTDLRVFQLDGQQFFATAGLLNRTIRENTQGCFYVILDWSRVQHIDSSVAQVVAKLDTHLKQRGVRVWHAGTQRQGHDVHETLSLHLKNPLWSPDLDRALEKAENHLLQHYNPTLASTFDEPTPPSWLVGLPEDLRSLLESRLSSRRFAPGEPIVTQGEASDCLWLMVRGHASVYLRYGQSDEVRIAGVSPGTTVGEMGFLDGSLRSATVVAESPVEAMRLSRQDFKEMGQSYPAVVQAMLTQLTIDLAARLRFASQKQLTQ